MRGLVTTVVQDFYGVIARQRKYQNAQLAADEGRHFLGLSQQLERGGEVAHSDVIKAQFQSNDRERDLQEARLAAEKARLDLAVLIISELHPRLPTRRRPAAIATTSGIRPRAGARRHQ